MYQYLNLTTSIRSKLAYQKGTKREAAQANFPCGDSRLVVRGKNTSPCSSREMRENCGSEGTATAVGGWGRSPCAMSDRAAVASLRVCLDGRKTDIT
jgi:hypothetical protein